jgi:RimJ/RimL family protein N-acetyltransferase
MESEIILVDTFEKIKETSLLASIIWDEYYSPIIGKDQVDYMVRNFQSEEAITNQIYSEGYKYFLIFSKGEPIGYIGFQIRSNIFFLSKYYIKQEKRGQGYGRYTMDFIIEQAREHKAESIYLTVNKNNSDSIKAYLKMGFKNEGPVVTDIGNGYVMDDYKMTLTLTS